VAFIIKKISIPKPAEVTAWYKMHETYENE